MIGFALLLASIIWLILRINKTKPTKKKKRKTKKKLPTPKKITPTTNSANSEPDIPSDEDMKGVATELLKKNPKVVSYVVKQWIRNQ